MAAAIQTRDVSSSAPPLLAQDRDPTEELKGGHKEAEAALGLPPDVHSYALLPIGYPMGRLGPVRRVALADVVYEDRWGQPYRDR